jgi:hypothetical protein
MATAINSPARAGDIDINSGEPQVFALKQPQNGREVGEYGSIMYSAVDGRKLFVRKDEASDFHHAMVDMQIQPAEFIRCTRVRHGGRGGGFSIRVERVPAEPTGRDRDYTPELRQSIEMARETRAANTREAAPQKATSQYQKSDGTQSAASNATQQQSNGTSAAGGLGKLLAGALCASIDAYKVTAEYAESKGVAFDFNAEDVRTSASVLLIEYFKREGGRA